MAVWRSTTSNNLKHVAKALNEHFQDKNIYIVADDDQYLENQGKINTGLVKAREAAEAVGGTIVSPDFAGVTPNKIRTDFNDMARLQGKDKVRNFITANLHKDLGRDQDSGRHKGPERSDNSHKITAERISPGRVLDIEKTGGLKETNNFELSVKEKSGETHTKQVFVNPKLVSKNDLGAYLRKKENLFVSSLGIEKHNISIIKTIPVEVKVVRARNIEMEMSM